MRSIFITGANQGLGFCTATHLSAKPNILLFIGSRKFSAAEEAITKFKIDKSSKVIPVQLDLTDKESIAKAVGTVQETLKKEGKEGLDVLVNNAGFAAGTFEEIYAVNVFGTTAFTMAMRGLLTKDKASIVNVSSTLGSTAFFTPENPMFAGIVSQQNDISDALYAYASSKSALNGLTNFWAGEAAVKKTGVKVVSLCPGYNATNLNNYQGYTDPMEGSQIIVQAALDDNLTSPSFFNKDGPVAW